jgi:carbamoyl-phosphate synthase large subunit
MPKRTDIDSILIIGAGPIVIGQACEFDYSGAQACKALREEGYRIILVNSNPATIMTDPGLADATYIEPITPDFVERIIARERPDAVLPTMGGQTALNTALGLHRRGVLETYGVELIGANADVIDKAEDRLRFREAMDNIGLKSPVSRLVNSLEEALAAIELVGLPAIIRPSFTLGGTGGGIAYNREEFEEIVEGGLRASPVSEVLIEQSVLGWKEYEMEVVRDQADNCIIVCSIENLDPMGIHTGDSITVAPALTLTDKEYQILRNASIACLREIGVDTGGSNVQFEACRRLYPGRARQRHHPGHSRLLRADDRLRRHQDAALYLREVQGRRPDVDHGDEVGRRSHGDRSLLPGIAAKGAALDGDRAHRPQRRDDPGGARR